ncbi:hypothetical protein CC2G_005311 [Coprinopsis cinerea AmutBmut pab1-1]|nr:hypothetical protein CC2G_005311 [Coprinopsis cinerea AmutBmut pab1-1]
MATSSAGFQLRTLVEEETPSHYFDDDSSDDAPMVGGFNTKPTGRAGKPSSTSSARNAKNRSVLLRGTSLRVISDRKDLPSGQSSPSNWDPPPSDDSFTGLGKGSHFSSLPKPEPPPNYFSRRDVSDLAPDIGDPEAPEPSGSSNSSSPIISSSKRLPPSPSEASHGSHPRHPSNAVPGSSLQSWSSLRARVSTPTRSTIPGSFISDSEGSDYCHINDPDPPKTKYSDNMTKRLTELAAQRRREIQAAQQRKASGSRGSTPSNNDDKRKRAPEPDAALKEEYEHALDALESTQEERDQLVAEKAQLEQQVRLLKQQINDFSVVVEDHEKDKVHLRRQVKQLRHVVQTQYEEPMVLHDQLDQAHYKLRKAERRNRYVDDTDRWKADAKYRKKQKDVGALVFGFSYAPDEHKDDILRERKGAQGLVAKSVTEVTSMMNQFNHDIFQTSAHLSKFITNRGSRYASVSTGVNDRARKVLGVRAVETILTNIPTTAMLNPLLIQIVLQIFLVFWCNSIIEAWYPKQATFAEFLVDVCSKLKVGDSHNICGAKTTITQIHTRDSVNMFSDWAQDIIDDLHEILSVFGWAIAGYQADALGRRGPDEARNSLVSLVKVAYDLRTAMAEISTSGDVDLAIISCDTPFNSAVMEDEFEDKRKSVVKKRSVEPDDSDDELEFMGNRTKGFVERVVGTTGIGLQKEVMKPHNLLGVMKRDIEMVLKPRVVLEQSLLEALDTV